MNVMQHAQDAMDTESLESVHQNFQTQTKDLSFFSRPITVTKFV